MKRVVLFMVVCSLSLSACGVRKTDVTQADARRSRPEQRSAPAARSDQVRGEAFVQEGIAGWFGKDYYGSTAKSGEKYDLSSLTAAHRTLPIGISVKVRNKVNGREAVVRVSERGPLVKSRIIDLSYAAAKRLGIGEKGSAAVRIEALGFRVNGAPGHETYRRQETFDGGSYTVQIGLYTDRKNAARISEEMRKLFGYSETRELHAKGERFYRVLAGKFVSLKDAEAAEKNFTEHGYPASFVLSLD